MRARGGAGARAFALGLALTFGSASTGVALAGDQGRFETVGAGRCSAAACHGSPTPLPGSRILRDEHTTWADRDPHAKAYQALHSSWSRSIATKLARGRTAIVPAHRDGRCLACHATPGPATDPGLADLVRQDGVSCESCHGPAGSWLALHGTYEWDALTARDKAERFGMVATGDLTRRAEACARCHVGEPGRDVDHDLIAAGHPRLSFEFSAYLANMPAHWVETGRNAAGDLPARAWAIGQAVTARASLELLRGRAGEAATAGQGPSRWPEFAEYDCASCHHDLRARPANADGPRPALAAWGTWPFPMTVKLAELENDPGANAFRSSIVRLNASMGEADPAPGQVAGEAGAAASALSRWLESLGHESFEPPRVEGLIRAVRSPGPDPDAGWDRETQEYLALVPLRQALPAPDRDRGGLLEEIHSRRTRLRLPFVAERPGAFGPSR